MSRPGLRDVREFARGLRRRVARRGLILLYHRVAENAIDPWQMCVTPAHFAEQLEVLAQRTRVVPLTALPAALARGRRGETLVAITFDDGYADNLEQAKPLLEQYGLPATVFVATGYVGQARFWWDELAAVILGPHPLPQRLELAEGVGWRVDHIEATPESREALLRQLWHDLRLLSAPERDRVLAALAAWAGVGRLAIPDGGRPLRADEIGRLADGGLIEVGAHTVSHPFLPALHSDAIHDELAASRLACERLVGKPVISFAYPFGGMCAEAVQQVRKTGFSFACTTRRQILGQNGFDPLQLPRLNVGDWDGRAFAVKARIIG